MMHFPLSYYGKDSGGAGRHSHHDQQQKQLQKQQQKQELQQRQAAVKQQFAARSHGRHHSHGGGKSSKKSQPFDPDDLRRRLYVVLAEQEASKQRKRHARQESGASATTTATSVKKAHGDRETQRLKEKLEEHQPQHQHQESQRDSYWEEKEVEKEKSGAVATQETCMKAVEADGTGNDDGVNGEAGDAKGLGSEAAPATAPYRHVPQTAASQFVHTTTSSTTTAAAPAADGTDRKKRRMHSALSYSALRNRDRDASAPSEKEGVLVRETIIPVSDASAAPKSKKSSRALRKMRSSSQQQDQLYETNSNQITHEGKHDGDRNHKTENATAKGQNLISIPVQDQFENRNRHTVCGRKPTAPYPAATITTTTTTDPPAARLGLEEYSTDEDCYTPGAGGPNLNLAAAAAHEQRRKADWTQSDEAYGQDSDHGRNRNQERRRSAFGGLRAPVLHRAESILTLKARLGSLMRHSSAGGGNGHYPHSKDVGRPATVPESDETTPPSSSGSPKSPRRLGFLGRLKR